MPTLQVNHSILSEAQVSEEYTDLHSTQQGMFLSKLTVPVQAYDKNTEPLLPCGAIQQELKYSF